MNLCFSTAYDANEFPKYCREEVPSEETLMIRSFFVVQKCWYSGPKVTPTVDYLRLIPSLPEAEQVAYQSAHVFASGASPVRTIQVPITHDAASSYGFVANGTLFWVRKIQACTSSGVAVSSIVDSAHCILTHGIIGGTGNPGSRKGTEDLTATRVFVGPAGYAWALKQSARGLVPPGSTCQWVPVGKPNLENITAEWPDRAMWHSPVQREQHHLHSEYQPNKRVSDSSKQSHWFTNNNGCNIFNYQSDSSDDQEEHFFHQSSSKSMEMDMVGSESNHYSLLPPAKRRCQSRGVMLQPDMNGGFHLETVPPTSPPRMDVFMGN